MEEAYGGGFHSSRLHYGEEHTSFLYNILSNDIKGMLSLSLTYNLRLKQNGVPLQEFYVYKLEDYYILDLQPSTN